jgi:hypothetical protein
MSQAAQQGPTSSPRNHFWTSDQQKRRNLPAHIAGNGRLMRLPVNSQMVDDFGFRMAWLRARPTITTNKKTEKQKRGHF